MFSRRSANRSGRQAKATASGRPSQWGVLVWALGLLLVAVGRPAAADAPAVPAAAKYQTGYLIRFEGPITPLSEQYLLRKLQVAQERQADLVAVEIDSPGGMLEPSLAIAAALRDITWARTVAYVPREALSGGAIVALGCDEIVMHPQAKLGDAGPIIQNEGGLFEHAPEKFRSHLVRHVRDLAEAKGRPPALAEAMVDKDLVVFHCRNRATGEERFLSELEIRSTPRPDDWEQLEPVLESQGANFLEVNGVRAVELKLASATAVDREALRQHLGLDSPWIVLTASAKDLAVVVLNHPLITGLLIVVGLVALFIELSAPGISLGGLVSLLCFALFFWSRFLGGTSGWLEVTLFLVGGVFLACELFILPGFGIAGIAGIALMSISILMASQDFVVPHTHDELITFARGVVVLVGSIICFLIIVGFVSRHMGTIPVFRRLVLSAPADAAAGGGQKGLKWFDPRGKPLAEADAAVPVAVGDWGVARTPLRPAGKARVGKETIDVVTDGAFIDAGRQIRIIEMQGSRVVVAEVPDVPVTT